MVSVHDTRQLIFFFYFNNDVEERTRKKNSIKLGETFWNDGGPYFALVGKTCVA